MTQYAKTENRLKKKKLNGALGTCGTITKYLTFMSLESHKGRRKRAGLKTSPLWKSYTFKRAK